LENEILLGARSYFRENDYTEVIVPHITMATGSCENINTLFHIDYWGREVYLSQTGQLYLETLIDRYRKVYCVSPSFRAEPRVDERHLTEFTLLEIELDTNFNGLLKEIENIFYYMLVGLKDKYGHLQLPPYPRITYERACNILDIEYGSDISSSQEKKLIETHDNKPLFLTHFPIHMKFFNMKRNGNVVNSADLIIPYGGECVGAAEREHEYNELRDRLVTSDMFKQLNNRGKGIDEFRWYLDYYKKHRILHSGCGIGLSRVVQYILKESDIRKCTTYPINREMVW